jgi:hypothetical protein
MKVEQQSLSGYTAGTVTEIARAGQRVETQPTHTVTQAPAFTRPQPVAEFADGLVLTGHNGEPLGAEERRALMEQITQQGMQAMPATAPAMMPATMPPTPARPPTPPAPAAMLRRGFPAEHAPSALQLTLMGVCNSAVQTMPGAVLDQVEDLYRNGHQAAACAVLLSELVKAGI